ncbi:MAG TPA: hypothetical protein VM012_14205 [Flavitalea sp.]|nr:hypothetical protein [Flavitalea sp.]
MNQTLTNTFSHPVIEENQIVAKKLCAIEILLDAFHDWGINYCHWKSNEHLNASMTADTDLDILFDINQKQVLEILLHAHGFKKFISIKQKQYRNIEDFLGMDFQSGKVIHVHAHFRLTLGEPFLKSYQLDLEEKILGSRVFDKEYLLYRIHPAYELILLFIRESLKIRTRDLLKMKLRNRIDLSENILREYRWIRQHCNNLEIFNLVGDIFTDHTSVYRLVTGDFNRKELFTLSLLLRKEFRTQRLYSPFRALLLRWYREITVKISRRAAVLLNRPVISRRNHPQGGLVIAVIGADGSGKSTVISNLQQTFKSKLDVYRVYMGRGDGSMSYFRKIVQRMKTGISPEKLNKKAKENKQFDQGKKGFAYTCYKCVIALAVAFEKRANLKRIRAAKKAGMMVICDRFPQNQFMGFNDGPLLHSLISSRNPIFRVLSKIEAKIYEQAQSNPPDLVFKLIADAEIVEARKPHETSLQKLQTKINGIRKMHFSERCTVIPVNAAEPLPKVLETIKRTIWDAYP